MLSMNQKLILTEQEDKSRKLVHFPDENRVPIAMIKKSRNFEAKTTVEVLKILKDTSLNRKFCFPEESKLEAVNLKEIILRKKPEKFLFSLNGLHFESFLE